MNVAFVAYNLVAFAIWWIIVGDKVKKIDDKLRIVVLVWSAFILGTGILLVPCALAEQGNP